MPDVLQNVKHHNNLKREPTENSLLTVFPASLFLSKSKHGYHSNNNNNKNTFYLEAPFKALKDTLQSK